MKTIQQLTKIVLLFTTAVFLFSSCEDDDEVTNKDMKFLIKYPTDISDDVIDNLEINFLNTTTEKVTKLSTDSQGYVEIKDMLFGTYNISASFQLSKDEFKILTGKKQAASFTFGLLDFVVNNNTNSEVNVILVADIKPVDAVDIVQHRLLISEVYDSPMVENANKCSFIELYNNSDEAIALDGLHIASLGGPRISEDAEPWPVDEFMYAETHIVIPGSGSDYVIEPGQFFTISSSAINFEYTVSEGVKESSIDMSNANIEVNSIVYNNKRGVPAEQLAAINTYFDFDNPNVPNADIKHISHMWWNLIPGGSSVVLFKTDKEFTDTHLEGKFHGLKIKYDDITIIDAMEFLSNQQSAPYKRIKSPIDQGFVYLPGEDSDYFKHKSVRRKRMEDIEGRLRLVDTNNSTIDFEENVPSFGIF